MAAPRAAALQQLTAASAIYRLALVSASGQVIHAAVTAGLAITVMAAGTIPQDLRPLTGSGLPELPQTCMQIVERSQGLSPAAKAVRTLAEGIW